MAFLTGLYVFVSILTLLAIREQAKLAQNQAISNEKKFREQLKVAGDAAIAAQQSADALMNSERAWVDVQLIRRTTTGLYSYQLEATNYGRTPAKITQHYFRQEFPSSDVAPPNILYGSTRTDGVVNHTKLLAPGIPWLFESFDLVAMFGEDTMRKVHERKMGLVYYGVLHYEDTSNRPHDTFFCYSYSVGQDCLMPINDPAYHKYT